MTREAAIRQLSLLLAVCVPLALLGGLWGAAFFDNYQGEVVAWRPLQAADGQDDRVRRYLLVRPGGAYQDIELPSVAFSGVDLPISISGVPPMEELASPPQVQKELFSFSVTVSDKSWSTIAPQDIVLPFLFLIAVVLGRNVLVTGSAFELVPSGRMALPGLYRPPEGSPEPTRGIPAQKGPPPQRKKGKSKGSSRARRRRKKK